MNKDKNQIGIIGMGVLGTATKKYFNSIKIKPLIYDKFKPAGSVAAINKADVIFICVPTPFGKKGFDVSAVESAIGILKDSKTVVVKSSVIPGTIERLQKKFPQHRILFNPEFLREASAFKDLAYPSRQILGTTKKSQRVAKNIMKLLPRSPYQKIMPSREAEMVKYMANSFLALKVVFANEFYDLCQVLKVDYEKVKDAVGKDMRIGDSHFNVAHGGYRGYGGSCFPKDVNAIMQLAKNVGIRTELLNAMRQINVGLLKKSGLDEAYFLNNKHKKL